MRSTTHEILKARDAQQFHRGFLDLLFRFVSRQNERRKKTLIQAENINRNDIKKKHKITTSLRGFDKTRGNLFIK